MPKPSWENLDDFLAEDTAGGFACPAVLRYQAGGTRTVSVIFDDPYFNAQLGEYEADASQPRISGKETELLQLRRADTVEIAGQLYDVLTSPQPDGTGWAMVELAPQDAAL
jgi:hypothetical protein